MSAPRTNIEKETRRHRWPLIGMALAVAFGVLLMLFWLFEEASQTDQPVGDEPPNAADVEQAPQANTPATGVQPQDAAPRDGNPPNQQISPPTTTPQ